MLPTTQLPYSMMGNVYGWMDGCGCSKSLLAGNAYSECASIKISAVIPDEEAASIPLHLSKIFLNSLRRECGLKAL